MVRTQISLTGEEKQLLDALAARTGRSLSALVREAIDTTYGPSRSPADNLAAIRATAGAWAARDQDGEAWVEGLRSGSRLSPPGP